MRGHILLKALDLLEESAYTTGDFLMAFLSSTKYNYSHLRNFRPKKHKTVAKEITRHLAVQENTRKNQQRIYNLLNKLSREGLIQKTSDKNGAKWKITPNGKAKKEAIVSALASALPIPEYKIERSSFFILVIFDIPETERRKRVWLRRVLKNLEFRMLQKSVWLGKTKVPSEFLETLNEFNLLTFVEIFSISKTGSLRQVN